MLVTDYTLEWVGSYQAILSWGAGVTSYWWTVYVNGLPVFSVEDSGTITQTIPLNGWINNAISIVRRDAMVDDVVSPDSARLLKPTVRWLAVTNAAEYTIYELTEDDTEYLLQRIPVEDDGDKEIWSWEVPADLPIEGVDMFRVKVYAKGSWGHCDVPTIMTGFVSGHPPRANTITANESSTGIELLIEAA